MQAGTIARTSWAALLWLILLTVPLQTYAQKIELLDGVRTVHNEKEGVWGKTPAVRLELVRTLDGDQPPTEFFSATYHSSIWPMESGYGATVFLSGKEPRPPFTSIVSKGTD
jgi:hypothetical protein